jgi:hypothetical protein
MGGAASEHTRLSLLCDRNMSAAGRSQTRSSQSLNNPGTLTAPHRGLISVALIFAGYFLLITSAHAGAADTGYVRRRGF